MPNESEETGHIRSASVAQPLPFYCRPINIYKKLTVPAVKEEINGFRPADQTKNPVKIDYPIDFFSFLY